LKTKKLTKNRTVIGIICIVIAILITFVLMPVFNNMLSSKAEILRFKQDIKKGTVIDSDMLETVTVGKYNLPANIVVNENDVVGKYAEADFFTGDYILSSKLAVELKTAEQILTSLDGNKTAMSISLKTFASGVSGKLKGGDVVSVIVVKEDDEKGTIPEELKYVKVVTSTTSKGIDTDDENISSDDEGENLPVTVTLLVNGYQSELLGKFEKEGNIHLSLVCRGENELAPALLEQQDKYLINVKSEVINNE